MTFRSQFRWLFHVSQGSRLPHGALLPVMLLAFCFNVAQTARGQVVPAGDEGGLRLSVGVAASGYTLNYGEQKLLGGSVFFEADTRRHLSAEAEVRSLRFHNTKDISATTYLAGARYFRDFGRFQPYAKGLAGFGHANLAFSLGQANSLVIAPGGGVDFILNRQIHLRLSDFEYQLWPQAKFTSAPAFHSIGISSGIRFRVF